MSIVTDEKMKFKSLEKKFIKNNGVRKKYNRG